jgi:hypothetical protein
VRGLQREEFRVQAVELRVRNLRAVLDVIEV